MPERYESESPRGLTGMEGAESEARTRMQEVQNPWAEELIQIGFQRGFERGEKRALDRFLASQRRMLVAQAGLRFGDEVAASLGEFLSRIAGPDRLAEVGTRIVTCESGEALLGSLDGPGV